MAWAHRTLPNLNTSSSLATHFGELASNITEFTDNFSNFASSRSTSDNQEIESLLQQIGGLQRELADIQVSIGAAIAAGTEIGLATAYSSLEKLVTGLQGQVWQALRDDISLINATQSALNSTATQDLPTMTAHLSLFTGVWQDVASDCTKLLGWLQDGAPFVDTLDIVAIFLNTSATIHDAVSSALTQYATQVTVPSMK
ncbi:hypothetical protein BC834DRAFT_1017870 [Gloeopeniophorella convolvens]|nr:hypothetical protein BC834DRAFT_1017870 [Gloeopeniophorella convolvens]